LINARLHRALSLLTRMALRNDSRNALTGTTKDHDANIVKFSPTGDEDRARIIHGTRIDKGSDNVQTTGGNYAMTHGSGQTAVQNELIKSDI
jgi:hypothetical protein